MGEAKRRGTFEQRQAEGIARREREEQEQLERVAKRKIERERQERERRAAMTDEERELDDVRKEKMAVVTGTALGLAGYYSSQIRKRDGDDIF